MYIYTYLYSLPLIIREQAWRSSCVMDCKVTAWGSIPDGYSVKTELHVLRKGQ